MTASKLRTPLPRSQRSPRSSAICGRPSMPIPRPVSKLSTSATRRSQLRRRQITRISTARLRGRKRRSTSIRPRRMNDSHIFEKEKTLELREFPNLLKGRI